MYNPQLETFLTVAEAGSFNRAAEKLYISPPAVIKQINLLERDLDLRLFLRTHRGLQLTKAGQSLYQDAKYIIQYCKDSVTRARNAMEEAGQVIRIGHMGENAREEKLAAVMKALDAVFAKLGVILNGSLEEVYRLCLQ